MPLRLGGSSMTDSLVLHRLQLCAGRGCRRLYAVCGSCGWTRRYCSVECRDGARRVFVREAGRRYQQTDEGRSAHAARQARYRERRREASEALPHALEQARQDPLGGPQEGQVPVVSQPAVTHHHGDQGSCRDEREARPEGAHMGRAGHSSRIPAPPRCVVCGRGDDRTFVIVGDLPLPRSTPCASRFRARKRPAPASSEIRASS